MFAMREVYSKVKNQIKVNLRLCIHTAPNQCPYKISIFYTLQVPTYSPGKILNLKVTTAQRSNQGNISIHTYTALSK